MTSPSPLWYASRGLGLVLLLVLTGSVVLGVLTVQRWRPGGAGFLANGLHRNLALIAMPLLALHGLAVWLDPFAGVRLQDLVVPFAASYRPLWLGLGVLAGEVSIAVVVTSLLRLRLGYGVWRFVHWGSYVAWPLALLHGLGTGSDTRAGWTLAIYLLAAGAVLVAVLVRLLSGRARSRWTVALALVSIVAAVAIGVFTWLGPMQAGWARAAGTPTKLLSHGGAANVILPPVPIGAVGERLQWGRAARVGEPWPP
ncbi:MAG: ferric reductase [Candidatus Dormiibacterota bacterium]